MNRVLLYTLAAVLGGAAPVLAQGTGVWSVQDGGNGHYYEVIRGSTPITWSAARDAAVARGGYLATITSAEESQFVWSLATAENTVVNGPGVWLGGYRQSAASDPTLNWQWVTGEPWSYTQWLPYDPQNDPNANFIKELLDYGYRAGWQNEQESGGVNIYSYAVEYDSPAQPHVWGVKVNITLADNSKRQGEFLVGFDGTYVVTNKDLTFNGDGTVTAGQGTPIKTITSITLVPNTTPTNSPGYTASFNTYGFNKCIVEYDQLINGSLRTVSKTVALGAPSSTSNLVYSAQDGAWRLTITALGTNSLGVTEDRTRLAYAPKDFYAIPRVLGINDLQARQADVKADAGLRVLIAQVAKSQKVPVQILDVVAWHESIDPYPPFNGLGWNQFGYVTAANSSPGTSLYSADAAERPFTVVTYDGGIGMCQITQSKALLPQSTSDGGGTLPPGRNIYTHLWKLASDVQENLVAGAIVLNQKKNTKPHIGMETPEWLDHWYTAVWRFNGANSYVKDRWKELKAGSPGRWDTATWRSDNTDVLNTYPHASPIPSLVSTLGGDWKRAHADVDNDGLVDIRVTQPSGGFAQLGSTDVLAVKVDTDPRRYLQIDTVKAVLTGGAFQPADGSAAVSELQLSRRPGSNVFASTMTGRFQRAKSIVATFAINVVGLGTADGATCQFPTPPN